MRLTTSEIQALTILTPTDMRRSDAANRYMCGVYSFAVEQALVRAGVLTGAMLAADSPCADFT